MNMRHYKYYHFGQIVLAEAIVYASLLLNRLPTTTIGGKTLLKIWSGEAARDHS